jgi:sulfur carrier protein ThiS
MVLCTSWKKAHGRATSFAVSLSPEAHLVMADERLVTEDYRLSQEENVKIIRVISGG